MEDHTHFMQPPAHLPWIDTIVPMADNPRGNFQDGEVQAMNRDRRAEWREWQEEHQ